MSAPDVNPYMCSQPAQAAYAENLLVPGAGVDVETSALALVTGADEHEQYNYNFSHPHANDAMRAATANVQHTTKEKQLKLRQSKPGYHEVHDMVMKQQKKMWKANKKVSAAVHRINSGSDTIGGTNGYSKDQLIADVKCFESMHPMFVHMLKFVSRTTADVVAGNKDPIKAQVPYTTPVVAVIEDGLWDLFLDVLNDIGDKECGDHEALVAKSFTVSPTALAADRQAMKEARKGRADTAILPGVQV